MTNYMMSEKHDPLTMRDLTLWVVYDDFERWISFCPHHGFRTVSRGVVLYPRSGKQLRTLYEALDAHYRRQSFRREVLISAYLDYDFAHAEAQRRVDRGCIGVIIVRIEVPLSMPAGFPKYRHAGEIAKELGVPIPKNPWTDFKTEFVFSSFISPECIKKIERMTTDDQDEDRFEIIDRSNPPRAYP